MFMFEIYDKAFFGKESINIFIKAHNEYEAEFRCAELFPNDCYETYYIDEYSEEEAEALGFDIF